MNYSPWLEDIYKSLFFPSFVPPLKTALGCSVNCACVVCSYACVSVCVPGNYFAAAFRSQYTSYRTRVDLAFWRTRSPTASELYFPFHAEMRVWSQRVYNQNIQGLRGSWEEGRRVHCRAVALMEAQFHRWASREAALLPFCYCSGQSNSPQTLSSQLHIAATTYWSRLLLWDPPAMPTCTAPLRLHRDQQ